MQITMNQSWYCDELSNRYGTVQRARGCYLYTRKGRRLVDLYQEAGRAILGWGNGSKAATVFKNTMNRGLTGSFATDAAYRLQRAVKTLLPEYDHVRWYSGMESACRAVSKYFDFWIDMPLGEHPILNSVADALPEDIQNFTLDDWMFTNGVPRWRPWLDDAWFSSDFPIQDGFLELNRKLQNAVAIVPPFPWAGCCYLVAFVDDGSRFIPPSDPVTPPFLDAVARAIYDLIAEIPNRSEKDWNRFDGVLLRYWKRRGPYLIPRVPPEKYREFYCHCADCGVVISPNYRTPSIVPYGATPGDFSELRRNPYAAT
ncbi:hypothetical protein [Treponema brennaborense]|uniref:Uncharacterized protein n=1 Tax=Treponema brennaborense (strain DSM 12168 / CIP 105900 / DD5/3) TaxID=906968 RepID=F4LKG2_TREBD|nr:hypothetical protein [Treponema brennaborense]AEE16536.1 hypothetical protein Trebr_1104 [Treponema brennaborense DSM 12168]